MQTHNRRMVIDAAGAAAHERGTKAKWNEN